MRTETKDIKKSMAAAISSSLFGTAVLAAGLVNAFWGNDPGFGIFLILISFVYFPPVLAVIEEKFDFTIPALAKAALAIFVIWAALGVGELAHKLSLMADSLI